jgi:hypothetical protein
MIQAVQITGTDLRTLPRGTFNDLSNLRALNLKNNALIRIDPMDLIGIPTLRDIYLAGTDTGLSFQQYFLAFALLRSMFLYVTVLLRSTDANLFILDRNSLALSYLIYKQHCMLINVSEIRDIGFEHFMKCMT